MGILYPTRINTKCHSLIFLYYFTASDSDEVASKKRGRDAVRNMNVYAKNLCESEEAQGRFGWFACLPDLNDGEGVSSSCQIAGSLITELGI